MYTIHLQHRSRAQIGGETVSLLFDRHSSGLRTGHFGDVHPNRRAGIHHGYPVDLCANVQVVDLVLPIAGSDDCGPDFTTTAAAARVVRPCGSTAADDRSNEAEQLFPIAGFDVVKGGFNEAADDS